MDNRWTEQFKDKMKDYQEIAPEGLWNDISDAVVVNGRKRGTVVLFRSLAGVAAAAAIVLGVIYMTDTKDNEYRVIVQVADIPSEYVTIVEDKEENDISNHHVSNVVASADVQKNVTEPVQTFDIDSVNEEQSCTDNPHTETPMNKTPRTDNPKTEIQGHEIKKEPHQDSTNPERISSGSVFEQPVTFPQTARKKNRVSISASFSGTAGNRTSIKGYSGSVPAASVSSFGTSPENEIRLFNRTREVTSGTSYRQPVNAGIKVNAYVSERWSIGTGIEWTWLRSTFREGSDEYYVSRISDLHYIGIPLTVTCDLWKGYGLKVYASAGGELQKCFSGRQVEEYVYNTVPGKSESNKLMEKQLQWSLRAEAGLGYDFSPLVGIYAEPGVTWHFNNGSQIDNIYKSRPFNFSISLGLKFNLR